MERINVCSYVTGGAGQPVPGGKHLPGPQRRRPPRPVSASPRSAGRGPDQPYPRREAKPPARPRLLRRVGTTQLLPPLLHGRRLWWLRFLRWLRRVRGLWRLRRLRWLWRLWWLRRLKESKLRDIIMSFFLCFLEREPSFCLSLIVEGVS